MVYYAVVIFSHLVYDDFQPAIHIFYGSGCGFLFEKGAITKRIRVKTNKKWENVAGRHYQTGQKGSLCLYWGPWIEPQNIPSLPQYPTFSEDLSSLEFPAIVKV